MEQGNISRSLEEIFVSGLEETYSNHNQKYFTGRIWIEDFPHVFSKVIGR